MTEYLIAARAVIILWTTLAVMPAELVLTRLKANWSAVVSGHKRSSRALTYPQESKEIGVTTLVPVQDP
jgi:hypothetical protein